jgi:hypothetical protein
MKFCCFGVLTLVVSIIQTSVIPHLPILKGTYGLIAPFVLFLGLYHSVYESLPFVLFLSLVMEGISGGPFGIYLTTYLLLFFGVKWLSGSFHAGNTLFLPLVVGAGALVEDAIFIGSALLSGSGFQFSAGTLKIAVGHAIWGMCTGPFLIYFFRGMNLKWQKRLDRFDFKKKRRLSAALP